MALNEKWKNIVYYRLDHITNMKLSENCTATDIKSVPGYENVIDFKEFAVYRPYMFSDKSERVEFIADDWMIDSIIDWFGFDFNVSKMDNEKIKVSLKVSPTAMEHWAVQYTNYVEVISPEALRERIKSVLNQSLKKYNII